MAFNESTSRELRTGRGCRRTRVMPRSAPDTADDSGAAGIAVLHTQWVLVVMDQYTRRIVLGRAGWRPIAGSNM